MLEGVLGVEVAVIVEVVVLAVSAIILVIRFFNPDFSCSFLILVSSLLNSSFQSFLLVSIILFSGDLLQLKELRLILVAQPHKSRITIVKLLTSSQSHRLAVGLAGLGGIMGIGFGRGGAVDCFFLLGIFDSS